MATVTGPDIWRVTESSTPSRYGRWPPWRPRCPSSSIRSPCVRGAAVSALRGAGAGGAMPGSDVPVPRVSSSGGVLRCRPHDSVQPRGSCSGWPDGAGKSQMSLPATSSAKNLRWVARYSAGGRDSGVDLSGRATIPNLACGCRSLPASLRGAGAAPPQSVAAAQRPPHCSGAPTQPRAATYKRRTAPASTTARKAEIAAREFRNHMRDMLFLFKGATSASPYAKWVNEPREPEELPSDWSPAVPVAELLPDDPPF